MNSIFAALSDPTRRIIIDRLRQGPASVQELADPFQISQQAVSKHLAYLEKADLIRKRKDGRQNMCELNPAPLQEVEAWVGRYREFWNGAIDRLDEMLKGESE